MLVCIQCRCVGTFVYKQLSSEHCYAGQKGTQAIFLYNFPQKQSASLSMELTVFEFKCLEVSLQSLHPSNTRATSMQSHAAITCSSGIRIQAFILERVCYHKLNYFLIAFPYEKYCCNRRVKLNLEIEPGSGYYK